MATKKCPSPPAEDADPAELSFEDSIQRLGQIVERLEAGELPLENSLLLFEQGIRLARASQAKLDRADRRVEELLGYDEQGNPVVREIETREE